MKFGGTSVQNEEAISRVIQIVRGRLRERPVVVVSALARVTRSLVELAEEAQAQHSDRVQEIMDALRKRHFDLCHALLEGKLLEDALEKVGRMLDELQTFAEGVCQIGELSSRSRARIVSTGELMSSVIVSAAMNASGIVSHWADARTMVSTTGNYMSATPDLAVTKANVLRVIPEAARGASVVLTQGFIASMSDGSPCVLGFEGSDYTAAILGMALGAERVEIWTDVDGIQSADPRKIQDTKRIEKVSYEEAAEMAWLGARVLHPMTIGPARMENIPIKVLNTMNPEGQGSLVMRGDDIPDGPKSVAGLDVDYLEVRARSLDDIVSGMAEHVMRLLKSHGVEVSLVSSSQSKVSVSIEPGQEGLPDAVDELAESYDVTLYRDMAQVSVVGRNAALTAGVCDKVLQAAGKPRMAVIGSSLMSVSVVVGREEARGVVAAIHEALF